jgi:hypothetical protein
LSGPDTNSKEAHIVHTFKRLGAPSLVAVLLMGFLAIVQAQPASAASPPPVTRTVVSPTGTYRVDLSVDIEHGGNAATAKAGMHCRTADGLVDADCRTLSIKRHRIYADGIMEAESLNEDAFFTSTLEHSWIDPCAGRAQYESWATFWVRFPDNSVAEIYDPLISFKEWSC